MTNTYKLADLTLLNALERTRLTRLGDIIEARVLGCDGGNPYRVRIDGSTWACSCPAAVYAGRRNGNACKHVSALRILRSALPPAFGGGTPS